MVLDSADPLQEREQALAYIFEMSSGLVSVAKHHELPFVAYLLEMAALAAAEDGELPRDARGPRS